MFQLAVEIRNCMVQVGKVLTRRKGIFRQDRCASNGHADTSQIGPLLAGINIQSNLNQERVCTEP